MDREICNALHSLDQAISRAQGPVFTDADYGRALRAFLGVCQAMDDQDRHFKARAAEAERIERERERERRKREHEFELEELLRELEGGSDE